DSLAIAASAHLLHTRTRQTADLAFAEGFAKSHEQVEAFHCVRIYKVWSVMTIVGSSLLATAIDCSGTTKFIAGPLGTRPAIGSRTAMHSSPPRQARRHFLGSIAAAAAAQALPRVATA